MDDAMLAKLLQTYKGAQPTNQNMNAARSFFAANPEIAEKRAMGLRGSGIDDNSDIFGAQLEQFMQAAEPEAPPGRVEVGPIEKVEAPAASTPQRAAPAKMNNMPAQPGQNRQAEYGTNSPITREAARGGRGFGLDDILLAFLGLRAAAGGNSNPPSTPPQKALPRAVGNDGQLLENPYPDGQKRLTYQPKLEEGGANARAAEAERTKTITNDPALNEQGKKAQLQAEIDAENADAKRLEDQIMKQHRDRVETKKLSDAAKRSVGRR